MSEFDKIIKTYPAGMRDQVSFMYRSFFKHIYIKDGRLFMMDDPSDYCVPNSLIIFGEDGEEDTIYTDFLDLEEELIGLEEVPPVVTKEKEKCVCSSKQLVSYGHQKDCSWFRKQKKDIK